MCVFCPLPLRIGDRRRDCILSGTIIEYFGILLLQKIDTASIAGNESNTANMHARRDSTTANTDGHGSSGVTSAASSLFLSSGIPNHISDTSIVKMFDIQVNQCTSLMKVLPSLEYYLGKVGYVTSWEPLPFTFKYVC